MNDKNQSMSKMLKDQNDLENNLKENVEKEKYENKTIAEKYN